MGTLFSITLFATNEPPATASAREAFRRINALEDVMSDYQADSELNQLCREPPGKAVRVSPELFDVLDRAQNISRLSGGAFDVTIGPYVRLWRFARKRKVLPTQEERTSAAAAVGYGKLRLEEPSRCVTLQAPRMRLDLGGIAKGYAADQALALLRQRGIDRALVAASGDIAVGNPPPGQRGWRIGIAGIDVRTNGVSRTVLLRNCGVSTSGDTEQFIDIEGVRYSHILNPKTGLGLTNRVQATIIAPDATTSDAMATTACILGAKRGLALVESQPHLAALVLTKEDDTTQLFLSRRFKALLLK
jgi:FAD:protein FMN transferase